MTLSEGIEYSFDIHSEKQINTKGVDDFLGDMFNSNEICTFGEEHNHNNDHSYEEVIDYRDIIFHLYREVTERWVFIVNALRDLSYYVSNEENKQKITDFTEFIVNFFSDSNTFLLSSSRVFARHVIPKASLGWFNYVICEWFSKWDPRRNYELSSDKVWYLLIILSAMMHWVNIHWAYDSHNMFWVSILLENL